MSVTGTSQLDLYEGEGDEGVSLMTSPCLMHSLQMISAEAPVVFAKACEIFILELTMRAWNLTEDNKRRTLQVGERVLKGGHGKKRGGERCSCHGLPHGGVVLPPNSGMTSPWQLQDQISTISSSTLCPGMT